MQITCKLQGMLAHFTCLKPEGLKLHIFIMAKYMAGVLSTDQVQLDQHTCNYQASPDCLGSLIYCGLAHADVNRNTHYNITHMLLPTATENGQYQRTSG